MYYTILNIGMETSLIWQYLCHNEAAVHILEGMDIRVSPRMVNEYFKTNYGEDMAFFDYFIARQGEEFKGKKVHEDTIVAIFGTTCEEDFKGIAEYLCEEFYQICIPYKVLSTEKFSFQEIQKGLSFNESAPDSLKSEYSEFEEKFFLSPFIS